MKKVIIITVTCLSIASVLIVLFSKSIKVTKPFDHPLFITKEDLSTTEYKQYKFIENLENKIGDTKIYYSIILPKEDPSAPSDAVMIEITQFKTPETAKQTYLNNQELGSRKTQLEYTDNYKDLGTQNRLEIFEDSKIAILYTLEESHIIQTQSNSIESIEKAKTQAVKFTKLMLEKIDSLET